MDLKLLEDFMVLAEQRSFTRAAELRNVTQATLSRRIQTLEHWAGTPLVEKGVYPTVLTAAGEALLKGSRDSVQQLLLTRALIRSHHFNDVSQIRLAVPDVIARTLFDTVFGGFGRKAGDSIFVQTGHVTEMIEKFLAGNVDILVSYVHPEIHSALDDPHFKRMHIQKDVLRCYALKDGPWTAEVFERSPSDDPVPICCHGPSTFFGALQEMTLHRNGNRLGYTIAMQSNPSNVVKGFVLNGYGIGWLPSKLLTEEDKQRLVPISSPAYEVPLDVFAFAKDERLDPSVSRLWKFLKSRALE